MTELDRDAWQALAEAHAERADRLTAARRARTAAGTSHPVDDFCYSYYGFSPRQLRRWHPGLGVDLLDAADTSRAHWRWYSAGERADSLRVDADAARRDKPELLERIEVMLGSVAQRPAQLGCFGLHEWAMVYRTSSIRHPVPLRLGAAGTDAVVESQTLRCSHYDAFRFFTAEAVPRNAIQPTRATQALLDQPGCLHAGMDVFKWALKLGPLVAGKLLLDAFELAQEIRVLDMEASPYDLSDWGYAPVPIETAEGRAEYVRRQRDLSERAQRLRRHILAAYKAPNQMPSAASASAPTSVTIA